PSAVRTVRPSFDAFHVHLHLAAARQADVPGLFVADAELEQLRLAVGNHAHRFRDDGALDAAPRDRADEAAALFDRKMAALGARRRTPGTNHRRQRNALAGGTPSLHPLQ